MIISFTLNNIDAVAQQCWPLFDNKKIIALHGPMGAGKTTFVHALCKAKLVSSTVGSPTYSLINQYSYAGGSMYHIDLYRLKDEEEALRAGVEDALYSGDICLVEWPERAPDFFTAGNTVHIFIEVINEQIRTLRIAAD
jgi:tRNA threonylcarbamoyladenosine biosynthesis protein TsaE